MIKAYRVFVVNHIWLLSFTWVAHSFTLSYYFLWTHGHFKISFISPTLVKRNPFQCKPMNTIFIQKKFINLKKWGRYFIISQFTFSCLEKYGLHAWSTPCRNAASKEAMIDNTNEASISRPQIRSLYVKTLKSEIKLCLLSNDWHKDLKIAPFLLGMCTSKVI